MSKYTQAGRQRRREKKKKKGTESSRQSFFSPSIESHSEIRRERKKRSLELASDFFLSLWVSFSKFTRRESLMNRRVVVVVPSMTAPLYTRTFVFRSSSRFIFFFFLLFSPAILTGRTTMNECIFRSTSPIHTHRQRERNRGKRSMHVRTRRDLTLPPSSTCVCVCVRALVYIHNWLSSPEITSSF